MEEPLRFLGVRIEILAIVFSGIAILFTALKDFILPRLLRPCLIFAYADREPFRRRAVNINRTPGLIGTFWRFSVTNRGRSAALNCRCQIETIVRGGQQYRDYAGYPLRWASRPESAMNQAQAERLNIGLGEREFIDLGAAINNSPAFVLQKYHSVDIGMPDIIEPGGYEIFLIFSGDNFSPYRLCFSLNKQNTNDPDHAEVRLISVRRV